jgi:hypothetical protein
MIILNRLVQASSLVAVLTGLAYPVSVHADDSPATQVKVIENAIVGAYGGRAEIGKVKTVVAKGTIVDFMKEKQGGYARYFARPGRLRIEIMPEQGGELRILNAGRGWRGSPEDLNEARQAALQAMVYQYSYLDLPMAFTDDSYKVSYGGRQDLHDRQLDLLVIEAEGAPGLRVYVDPEKRLIVRVAADFNMGMGSSELATEYEDYRPVGKVLFPFRLINYAGELKLSVISLSEIRVNEAIPPEMFSPKGPKAR